MKDRGLIAGTDSVHALLEFDQNEIYLIKDALHWYKDSVKAYKGDYKMINILDERLQDLYDEMMHYNDEEE